MKNKRRWVTWLAMLAILLYGIGPLLAASRLAREPAAGCAAQAAACCCRPAQRATGKCCCNTHGAGNDSTPCQMRRGPCRPQAPIASPSGTVYAPIAVLAQGSVFDPYSDGNARLIPGGASVRTLAVPLLDPPPQASAHV